MRAAPPDATPRDLVAAAMRALARELQPDRAALRVRAGVVASDIALQGRDLAKQGRDLAKQGRWTVAIADELTARNVPVLTAALLAAAGAGAFRTVYAARLADSARTTLDTRVDRALDDLAAALS